MSHYYNLKYKINMAKTKEIKENKNSYNFYENNNDFEINNISLEQLVKEIKSESLNMQVEVEDDRKSKDDLEEKVVKDIITNFANKYNTDSRTALIAITKFIQDGGTNSSRPNMTRKINKIDFELSDLRQVIRLYDKYGTVRKLAKSLRQVIATIAIINKWPGPLYKDIQRINPSLIISETDAVYCSEFNSDNYDPEMPARIREALQQREQKIREDRNRFMFQKNKVKQGKRRRGRNKK